GCLSIRWFVPLLAPAYSLLALELRHRPRSRADLVLLSAWGGVLVLLMREGPWTGRMVPGFWPVQAAALLCWGALGWLRQKRSPLPGMGRLERPVAVAAKDR